MSSETKPAIINGHTVIDGAGVRLRRIFGFGDTELTDPFLLLDVFGSDDPDDYIDGFPWHPHRGIETVTYMMEGSVQHGDSLGNTGTISDGDVQWMTAGSGIIHQEMPQLYDGTLRGFQLWVNLPAASKMTQPKYRDIRASKIPVVTGEGFDVRVICGSYGGVTGPAEEIVASPVYLDVKIEGDCSVSLPSDADRTTIIFLFEGNASVEGTAVTAGDCAVFKAAESLSVKAAPEGARCLFITGKPIGEPVAWRGPIVMNTEKEIETAFREYRDGNFIKHKTE